MKYVKACLLVPIICKKNGVVNIFLLVEFYIIGFYGKAFYFKYSSVYINMICLQYGRPGFNPWTGKIPQRRDRLLTPVF